MKRDSTPDCLLFRLLRDCSSPQNSLDEEGRPFFMRIIAADTGIPYELNIGDRVELIGSIRLYNGGKIIHGPDTGHIMDIRDKVERLAIRWQQARFGGWYDAKDLARVATGTRRPDDSPPQARRARLGGGEVGRAARALRW